MKTVIIGRDKDNCNYVLNDKFISRVHVQIVEHEDGSFTVFDLESSTGTFVNGKKITKETKVYKDDIIKLGNTVLNWNPYFIKDKIKKEIIVSDSKVDSPINITNYATFWDRLFAALIDGVLTFLFLMAFNYLFIDVRSDDAIFFINLLNIISIWLYFALSESSYKQATIGKRALNIVVTDINGGKISFGQATGRYFGKIISSIFLYIGFLMPLWTEKKQTLHDQMASCVAIKKG